jgi:catechol 2,3-dioxygenase-like lactoylglutathione lyase family enzyme
MTDQILGDSLGAGWDISHITVAVPDIEAAMAGYATAFGVEWGKLEDFSGMEIAAPLYPDEEISMEGLRLVWSRTNPALELAQATSGSPAERLWGVEKGEHRLHHVCYWVDDLGAASEYLADRGFALEITLPPGDVATGFAYHRNAEGMRVELMRSEDKPAVDRWLATGESELQWRDISNLR